MRVVTWNCNGALRNKLQHMLELDADVYIVQECEDPSRTKDKAYNSWACNYLWKGPNKNKGVGVFAKEGVALQPLSWAPSNVELFLPCRIGDELNVLGVWTRDAGSPTFKYIGQFWKYLQDHWRKMHAEPILIVGDFNSNVRWDVWDRWWNHSDVVNQLASLGIHSAYHAINDEQQGQEQTPTFFHYRKRERPYHIDYMFASSCIMQQIKSFEIGEVDKWLEVSDHLPLMVDF